MFINSARVPAMAWWCIFATIGSASLAISILATGQYSASGCTGAYTGDP